MVELNEDVKGKLGENEEGGVDGGEDMVDDGNLWGLVEKLWFEFVGDMVGLEVFCWLWIG